MADEFSYAVSFANGYFALVDGLASDLENYLAEDVMLDWFGQTIKGRRNVAAFMKYKKISSRHIFYEIIPRKNIGYNDTHNTRRKYYSAGSLEIGSKNYSMDADDDNEVKYKRTCYSDTYLQHEGSFSEDSALSDVIESEMDSDYLNTIDDLSREFKPEITDSVIKRELNMEALKLDNFTTPKLTFKPERKFFDNNFINNDIDMAVHLESTEKENFEMKIAELRSKNIVQTEIEQGGVDKSGLKFLEACGVIEFCKVFNVHQIRKDTRKRHCRLQIAYSNQDQNANLGNYQNEKKIEVRQIEGLTDYEKERNEFLESLHLQMMKQESNINIAATPKYIGGQLKFDKPPDVETFMAEPHDTNRFIFNYKIHVIIYESNTKCRLNLSHEFDGEEYLENTD